MRVESLQILEHLSELGDATRIRILSVLEQQELTVAELCAVLQLPQSTVSRHLKVLAGGAWVQSHPDGTRRLYRLVTGDLAPAARDLWQLAREQIVASTAGQLDSRRLERVLAGRRSRSREFFASVAGRWDRMRDELFGPRVHSLALLGLLDGDWTIGDLGCGTGAVAEALAPFVRRVIGVDGSQAMLDAAGARLAGRSNVELRRGELESLPVGNGQLDAATLILVLHHLPDPARVIREVARVLKPGGKLLLCDMLPHDRSSYQQEMGHVWLGFDENRVGRLASDAGLRLATFRPLPTDPDAQAPDLFAAALVAPPGSTRSSNFNKE